MSKIKEEPEKFKCLPMSSYICNALCKCLDSPTNNKDCGNCAPAGEPCCVDCYCCISPFAFLLDILSFPCRGCYYCKKKRCDKQDDILEI